MPTHRGIKLSLVSQLELKIHPEFPHPDSSQFTYRSPITNRGEDAEAGLWGPPTATLDSKADRLLGRATAVSVYTPSMPGARFWVKYTITEPAIEHCQWYYFKLFMNGRHITSWGTNARKKPSGKAMRGLFEPTNVWNYEKNGVVYKNMGTESRPFFFGNEAQVRSVADDGGLIEVRIFRARGRKRRIPSPPEFKNQHEYGIIMPTTGLLERPQDAKFYDWHLRDPKDSPFAVFKFHYRSWDSLNSLQLIPLHHPRQLLPPSPKTEPQDTPGESEQFGNFRDNSEAYETEDEDESEGFLSAKEDLEYMPRASIASEISATPWLTNVFDVPASAETRGLQYNSTADFSDPQKREIPRSRFSSLNDRPATPESPTPASWQHIIDRPLPKIPERSSSKNYSAAHSRTSSRTSNPASLSPSLVEHVERNAGSPDPFIGTATAVVLPRDVSDYQMPALKDYLSSSDSAGRSSGSDHERSPLSKQYNVAKREGMAIQSLPLDEFTNQSGFSNVTLRKPRHAPARVPPPLSSPPNPNHENTELENEEETPSAIHNLSTMSLSPSEWLCRTPSPVKHEAEQTTRMWSPSPREPKKSKEDVESVEIYSPTPNDASKLGRMSGKGSIKKRAMQWYDHVRQAREEDADATMLVERDDDRFGGGWI